MCTRSSLMIISFRAFEKTTQTRFGYTMDHLLECWPSRGRLFKRVVTQDRKKEKKKKKPRKQHTSCDCFFSAAAAAVDGEVEKKSRFEEAFANVKSETSSAVVIPFGTVCVRVCSMPTTPYIWSCTLCFLFFSSCLAVSCTELACLLHIW